MFKGSGLIKTPLFEIHNSFQDKFDDFAESCVWIVPVFPIVTLYEYK